VSNNFFVRGGYNYEQQDPDIEIADDRVRMHTAMAGIGFSFVEQFKLDLAYSYKFIRLEENTDERIIDHVVMFFLKRLL
jgi:opacity protein-like surface antigen